MDPAKLRELPARNAGRFSRPGDPWNLMFCGSEPQVTGALEAAGWTRLPGSILSSIGLGLAQLARRERLTLFPPMNLYRLNGRGQDHNWVQVVRPIVMRHHFRLWRIPLEDGRGRPCWWGSANFDLDARCWDLSHRPDPDTVAEREYIADSLKGSAWVESMDRLRPGHVPLEGTNDKGYPFRTDGSVLVVSLSSPKKAEDLAVNAAVGR